MAVIRCSLAFCIWEQSELCVHGGAGEHTFHLAMHRECRESSPVPAPALRCPAEEDATSPAFTPLLF